MADVKHYPKPIAIREVYPFDFDFSALIPEGESISGAVSAHTPPTGGTPATPSVGTPAAGIVPVLLGPLVDEGQHNLSCTVTLTTGAEHVMVVIFEARAMP
jgi:hypothetical protein